MYRLDIVLFLHCTAIMLGASQAATLPEDWKDRIDSRILESRESQVGLCDLDDEIEVEDGAFASAVGYTGKLTEQNYWPNSGKGIPYVISPNFDSSAVNRIRQAMEIISIKTHRCITFTTRTDQANYIYFRKVDKGCRSRVGKRIEGGPQDIRLSQGCIDIPGNIQHEILHALGLFHEQNRPDRDDYVDIYQENIDPEFPNAVINFQKLPEMQVYHTFYDLNSIMHYGAFDFARRLPGANATKPTIVPKKTVKKALMGQRRQMSVLDVAKIQNAYGCDFDEGTDSTTVTIATTAYTPTTTKKTTTESPRTESSVSVNTATTPGHTDADSWMSMFSTSPMQQAQCDLTFGPKCSREYYQPETCTETHGLEIDCKGLTAAELSEMVTNMARPPIRPVRVDIDDGRDTVTELMFRPIRRQIIGLELWSCKNSRSTGKLVSLNLENMLHLELTLCYNLDIKKGDFRNSKNLRVILVRSSTIAQLEEETFMDLPKLQLLSMEYERHGGRQMPQAQATYTKALHCGCHFMWLRKWFIRNPSLMAPRSTGEVYSVDDAFQNQGVNQREIYRPFDCEGNRVDYTLGDFSTPARLHLDDDECSS